jgi:hypothetical protein
MDIALAIFAWRRGWKAWSLLPIGVAFFIVLVISGSEGLDTPAGIFLYFLVALAELGTLGYMVAKPRQVSQPGIWNSARPAGAEAIRVPDRKQSTPLPATIVCSAAMAKLVLPDGSEIPVDDAVKPIGRNDFDKAVSPEDLKYISRQHLMITAQDDKYFVEDLNSTNGTKANGSDIQGKSRQELKDGDRIEVADMVALTFKV